MKNRCATAAVEMHSGFDSRWIIGKGLTWSLFISLSMHTILLTCAWPMSVQSPGFSSADLNVQLVGNNQKGKPAHGIVPVVESTQRVVSAPSAEPLRSSGILLPDKSSSVLPVYLHKRLPVVSSQHFKNDIRTDVSDKAQASGVLASASGAANQSDGAASGASGGSDASRTGRQTDSNAAHRGSHKDDLHQYRADLIAVARGIKTYPTLARERGWEGTVEVELRFNASTRLSDVNTVRSGGHRLLDDQALEIVRLAATSVPLPDSLASADFRLLLPVAFRLE